MMRTFWRAIPLLVAIVTWIPHLVQSRAVFAHYLVGTVTDQHAAQDIQDAIDMGLDAFALNIGNPYDSFVTDALESLFAHATGTSFKLFISMDLYAQGDACYTTGEACNGPSDYDDILSKYLTYDAYFKGDNDKPMVSTFSAAKWENDTFLSWRENYDIYFVPDFDATEGYYEGAAGWWDYWGPTLDGAFSWESAWPEIFETDDGNITKDETVIAAAVAHSKSYMMPLSLLQYKNAYGTNLYRRGEQNLPIRMQNILSMDPAPLYVEVISWNDGPEGHYIGNLWPEQNTDWQPAVYASQGGASHTALQPVIQSFATAFRELTSEMVPPGDVAVGAIWYKTIMQSTYCINDGVEQFFDLTNGSTAGQDTISWVVVLPASDSGLTIELWSNNELIQSVEGTTGLNYGSTITTGTSISPGTQMMQIVDSDSNVKYSASNGRCVSAGCPDDIYNFNPQVLPLVSGAPTTSCLDVYVPICISGTGEGDYADLCSFTCEYGFCPSPTCTCSENGTQATLPTAAQYEGYPADSSDTYAISLCSFACYYGYCPESMCSIGDTYVESDAEVYDSETAFTEALSLSDTDTPDGDLSDLATRLVNFSRCDDFAYTGVKNGSAHIYSGWMQANKIMAVKAIKNGAVDFNSAAALEYLGPPALNKPQQNNMNGIFKQFATITPAGWYNPFAWKLAVRCDDPQQRCSCGSVGPYAYTSNQVHDLTYINFCPRYFQTPTLNGKIAANKGNDDVQVKYNMDQYWETQGHIWTHELMHIDWVANAIGPDISYGPNSHVVDLTITVKGDDGEERDTKAYQPLFTKILARYPEDTGYYTIKNADSLACFMTALYVQSVYGSYPNFPVVTQSPFGPPWQQPWSNLFLFDSTDAVTLNTSNPIAVDFNDDTSASCEWTDSEVSASTTLTITSFAANSLYPTPVLSSLTAADASETEPPDALLLPTSTPTCVEEQDPDSGTSGVWCSCNGYPSTLPLLSRSESPCAYSTLPSIPATTTTATPTTSTAKANPSCTVWTDCPDDLCSSDEDLSCTNGSCVCWTSS